MKRLVLFGAALAALTVGGMRWSTPSYAAAGCGTHQVAMVSWIDVTGGGYDSVDVSYDFQCGGNTSNYRIVFHLQESTNGSWVYEACGGSGGGGATCTVNRPGPSSFFTAGTEHGLLNTGNGPDWQWNTSTDIKNQWFRVQAVVHFANGDPNLVYYSQERQL